MEKEAKAVRELIRRKRAEYGGRRPRFGTEIRSRAAAYAESARGKGLGVRAIAEQLGVGVSTLESWCRAQDRTPRAGLFRAVAIAPLEDGLALSLVTPDGFRIEGLSVESLPIVLSALR